jgi:GT2 family glycosyltransferase
MENFQKNIVKIMKHRIGLGLITCNRPDFFKKSLKSIPLTEIQEFVVINDGEELPAEIRSEVKGTYIKNDKNQGVGKSKNKAINHLLSKGCTDIFLMEDDIIIKNSGVFKQYINISNKTKLKHFMYGYHGPANKNNGTPTPRLKVNYDSETSIALNLHCVGAFCYYTADLLDKVGINDEFFTNAWEHVEHSYRIVKQGYLPGYWWWPDLVDSYDYLDEIACSEVSSTIRPRNDWKKNIEEGARHFYLKHGFSPVSVPDQGLEQICKNLQEIFKQKND